MVLHADIIWGWFDQLNCVTSGDTSDCQKSQRKLAGYLYFPSQVVQITKDVAQGNRSLYIGYSGNSLIELLGLRNPVHPLHQPIFISIHFF